MFNFWSEFKIVSVERNVEVKKTFELEGNNNPPTRNIVSSWKIIEIMLDIRENGKKKKFNFFNIKMLAY